MPGGLVWQVKRIRKNKDFIEDPRNYLFKYYYEVLKYFEPEFFCI